MGLLFANTIYAQSTAQAIDLDVAGIGELFTVTGEARYFRHPAEQRFSPEQILAGEIGDFVPLPNDEISFGYTTDHFWIVLDTINSSSEARSLVLDTNVKYMEPLIVYEASAAGVVTQLLVGDETQPFGSRPLPTAKLTIPLAWQAGERKRLLFYVASGSGVDMTLQLGSTESVIAKYTNNRTFFALFTGILLTLILINLFHFYAVRRLAHLLYAAQELSILLFMLHIDGLAFQYVWPNSPVWNAHATMVFGHLTNLMAVLFAVSFLELKSRAPLIYRGMMGFAGFIALMLLLTPVIEPQYSDQAGLLESGVGSMALFATGIYIAVSGYRPARYFVAGWLFLAMGAFVYGLTNLAVISLPFAPIILLRSGVLAEALLLSYGLADQLKSLNDSEQRVQRRLLESTRQRLQEARELALAEQATNEAERGLQLKDLDMARARHDIRQPIYSLRMALLASQQRQPQSDAFEVINRSLDHMEAVLGNEQSAAPDRAGDCEPISHGDLMQQLKAEFTAEAAARTIEIRTSYSSIAVTASLVSLKRVLSNLLANAIRHSGANRVLLGLRRRDEGIELMIADNGCGLAASAGEAGGEGLGLGIVKTICAEHGWELNCSSEANLGTVFTVKITNQAGL